MCAATTEPMDTGLSEKLRAHFALQLSGVLDDAYSLMVQTHVYHWNVRGPLFEPIHKLLQQHYETLFETADEIAERVRQLGFAAPLGAKSFPSGVKIPAAMPDEDEMLADLLSRHEAALRKLRPLSADADENQDFATQDLLNHMLAFHEKAAWMLRSILTSGPGRQPVRAAKA